MADYQTMLLAVIATVLALFLVGFVSAAMAWLYTEVCGLIREHRRNG